MDLVQQWLIPCIAMMFVVVAVAVYLLTRGKRENKAEARGEDINP